MAVDCSSLVAQVPLSPPEPVPAPPNYLHYLRSRLSSPPKPRHILTPSLVRSRPRLPVLSTSKPVPYPQTLVQVSRLLRGPAVTHAGWVICPAYFFHPLALRSLIRY